MTHAAPVTQPEAVAHSQPEVVPSPPLEEASAEAVEEVPEAHEASLAQHRTGPGFDPRKVEVLSLDRPRAFLYHGFMSAEECDHLVALSRSGLHKSGVVDAETGGSLVSDIRTSSGAFIGRGHDAVTRSLEARIAAWSQVPETHGEAFQVLRYELGQEYRAHFDYFFHKAGALRLACD